jgi:glycosyltransferase involved in cell wall biosynthesis
VFITMHDYRVPFYDQLRHALGSQLETWVGKTTAVGASDGVIVPSDAAGILGNRSLLDGRMFWQGGVQRAVSDADVAILILNPQAVSTWLVLLRRRLEGRPTILWGHARGLSSTAKRNAPFRRLFFSLASVIVVYTEREAELLRTEMPAIRVLAAPNSLYQRADICDTAPSGTVPRNFLYVGRLIPSKKPFRLVEAFARSLPGLHPDTSLLIAGDGPERARIEAFIGVQALHGRVRLLGHVSSREALRELYETAVASVSPGYAGLSLTQSLSFGVPMVISKDEPHAPEIEAAREGFNAWFYRDADEDALPKLLRDVSHAAHALRRYRTAIAADCADRYSVELMVERMLEAIRLAAAE